MVTLRVTIKGSALACLCFAQDCPPSGDHGPPKGDNQALCACMLVQSTSMVVKIIVKNTEAYHLDSNVYRKIVANEDDVTDIFMAAFKPGPIHQARTDLRSKIE